METTNQPPQKQPHPKTTFPNIFLVYVPDTPIRMRVDPIKYARQFAYCICIRVYVTLTNAMLNDLLTLIGSLGVHFHL